ncbi:hypothetical protein RF11_03607 [Thelohanellus kitauei]|uniref:Uncharacterized protein n=1 Tax=Thelohanellus kitauei TaxID=669202 RepID=A0A0C2NGL8_THEKT|nr:hypothetical protein RF11_03607 [Thelohanellus kitauei]
MTSSFQKSSIESLNSRAQNYHSVLSQMFAGAPVFKYVNVKQTLMIIMFFVMMNIVFSKESHDDLQEVARNFVKPTIVCMNRNRPQTFCFHYHSFHDFVDCLPELFKPDSIESKKQLWKLYTRVISSDYLRQEENTEYNSEQQSDSSHEREINISRLHDIILLFFSEELKHRSLARVLEEKWQVVIECWAKNKFLLPMDYLVGYCDASYISHKGLAILPFLQMAYHSVAFVIRAKENAATYTSEYDVQKEYIQNSKEQIASSMIGMFTDFKKHHRPNMVSLIPSIITSALPRDSKATKSIVKYVQLLNMQIINSDYAGESMNCKDIIKKLAFDPIDDTIAEECICAGNRSATISTKP